MDNTAEKTIKKKPDFLTITTLVILSLGTLFSLGGSLLMALVSIISLVLPYASTSSAELFITLSVMVMMAIFGCLMIPGIVFMAQKLNHKQPNPQPETDPYHEMPFSRVSLPTYLLIGTAAILVITFFLGSRFDFPLWFLPFLQVPAVLVPLYWIYQFTVRKVYPRNPRRIWTALGMNLTLQAPIAIILEVAILIGLFLLIVIWLVLNPDLVVQIQNLILEFENAMSSPMSFEESEQVLAEILKSPWIFIITQLFISVLVPLLEELIKPMLVWRWIKHPLRPIDGFWLGLIGGTAFTLYENLSNLAQTISIDEWYFVLLSRIGTSILHMATAAILGWALMKTFEDRKILRVLGTYLFAAALHGGWNFFAVLEGFSTLPIEESSFILFLSPISIPMMIMVGLICSGILILGPKLIMKTNAAPALPNTASENETL